MRAALLVGALAMIALPAWAATTKVGAWEVDTTKDPMTSKSRVVASVFNGAEGLAFRCCDEELSIVLVLPQQADGLKPTEVSDKIDENEIRKRQGDPFGRVNLELLEPVQVFTDMYRDGKKKAFFRYAAADEVVRTVEFPLRGAKDALEKVATCMWGPLK